MDIITYQPFVNEIKELIQKKQFQTIKIVNTETINLYWEIGEEIYRQQREKGWGKSIVQILAKELQKEFPGTQGYSAANLWRMRNFYLTYCNSEKLAPLVREISWSNNIAIMENLRCPYIGDDLSWKQVYDWKKEEEQVALMLRKYINEGRHSKILKTYKLIAIGRFGRYKIIYQR